MDLVQLKTRDTAFNFTESEQEFSLKKGVYRKLDYAITTSNEALKEYENLSFALGVIRDEYPEINVDSKQDSTDSQMTYFLGQVSDDYGLTKLQLVYYAQGDEKNAVAVPIKVGRSNVD